MITFLGLLFVAGAIGVGLHKIADAIKESNQPIITGTEAPKYIVPKAERPAPPAPQVSQQATIIRKGEPVDDFLKEQNG